MKSQIALLLIATSNWAHAGSVNCKVVEKVSANQSSWVTSQHTKALDAQGNGTFTFNGKKWATVNTVDVESNRIKKLIALEPVTKISADTQSRRGARAAGIELGVKSGPSSLVTCQVSRN